MGVDGSDNRLREVQQPETDEDERIEVVRWPLADLDGAIDACVDAKTLIGLLLLRTTHPTRP